MAAFFVSRLPLLWRERAEERRGAPTFLIAYEAVAKMNQAKTPRAVVRSAA